MNEILNLVEILKDCPKGTKLYSTIYGEVEFDRIEKGHTYSIVIVKKHPITLLGPSEGDTAFACVLTKEGKYDKQFDGECILFPSKDHSKHFNGFTHSPECPCLKKGE